ncbi:MAG TPA: asparagine synthase (glutamine-hydrolyzing) [Gemmataceae bacterium]|nr:asparagine synthase (glutamine-hydrolyzing) [Gemmataceae bacterium]
MCGILGVYNYGNDAVPVSGDLLVRLRDTLRHRGPDDAGCWRRADGRVGLAHRRLSIIDLSADGRQPMANEDETAWITFNGEVYNHLDLRARLTQRGHRFRSRSDTEAILHLYEEVGAECVRHLDGMFAFGVWDEDREALFLARDRLGVKPLYYTQQHGVFLFASEIKALLAHPLISADLEPEALAHYLTFKTTPAPLTMFAGIRKLPAGCHLTCDRRGQVEVVRYWDAVPSPLAGPGDSEAAAAGRVRALLTESVSKRLMSDVPTGVFLSGGLDSSAVVALLAPRASGPVNTFSIGIKDLEGENELEYARQVARRFATNHQELLIGREDLEAYLPDLVYHQDEPLADPVCVPLYYLARHARRSGTVVVQVGEGSDEQFFGYDSRLQALKSYHRKWRPLLALPRWLVRGLHGAASGVHRATGRAGRWQDILGRAAAGEQLFWGSVAFGEHEKGRLLTDALGDRAGSGRRVLDETLRPLRDARPAADFPTRVAYLDLKIRLAELLLMRIDKVTMSQGVEAREPFLDYRLVEYLMAVPWRWKLRRWRPKHLLKRAVAGLLPDNIVHRPKKAFAAPVAGWLRHGLAPFAARVIFESRLKERGLFRYDRVRQLLDDHVQGRADHGVQLWTLMNLSGWYDCWIAGTGASRKCG